MLDKVRADMGIKVAVYGLSWPINTGIISLNEEILSLLKLLSFDFWLSLGD